MFWLIEREITLLCFGAYHTYLCHLYSFPLIFVSYQFYYLVTPTRGAWFSMLFHDPGMALCHHHFLVQALYSLVHFLFSSASSKQGDWISGARQQRVQNLFKRVPEVATTLWRHANLPLCSSWVRRSNCLLAVRLSFLSSQLCVVCDSVTRSLYGYSIHKLSLEISNNQTLITSCVACCGEQVLS